MNPLVAFLPDPILGLAVVLLTARRSRKLREGGLPSRLLPRVIA